MYGNGGCNANCSGGCRGIRLLQLYRILYLNGTEVCTSAPVLEIGSANEFAAWRWFSAWPCNVKLGWSTVYPVPP